jgi:hypothetical protein
MIEEIINVVEECKKISMDTYDECRMFAITPGEGNSKPIYTNSLLDIVSLSNVLLDYIKRESNFTKELISIYLKKIEVCIEIGRDINNKGGKTGYGVGEYMKQKASECSDLLEEYLKKIRGNN